MEKRSKKKKERFKEFRDRLQKTIAIFMCVALLVFFLNLVDMSTRRMMICNDDRYAMAVSLQEGDILRVDIAGEKLSVSIEPVVSIAEHVIKYVRDKL